MTNDADLVAGLCMLCNDCLYSTCPCCVIVDGVNVVFHADHTFVHGAIHFLNDILQHHLTIFAAPGILVGPRLISRAYDNDHLLCHLRSTTDNLSVGIVDWLKATDQNQSVILFHTRSFS